MDRWETLHTIAAGGVAPHVSWMSGYFSENRPWVVNPWKYWDLRPEKRVISWSHLIQHVQRNLPSGKQKKFAIEHGPVEMSWIYPLNMVDLSIVFLGQFTRSGQGWMP
jgi:hypothetical protein